MQVVTASGRGVWLTYGMNVHPGGTLDSTRAALEHTVRPLRERLGAPGPFGIALRLDAETTAHLAEDRAACTAFADELERLDLHPFTANAFVAGAFHGRPVKEAVYAPSWADAERLAYTVRSAEVLARLARRPGRLSISSAPGSWRAWGNGPAVDRACARGIAEAGRRLRELAKRTGRRVDLGLEPEPGCTLQTVDEVITFFRGPLADAFAGDDAAAGHVGICYDVCHQAVVHESVAEGLQRLRDAGVRVAKLQASCALEVPDPSDGAARDLLAVFDEPVYLHQVGARDAEGRLHVAPDLPHALAHATSLPAGGPWRVHFHMPVFRALAEGGLATTQPVLDDALSAVAVHGITDHVEVETYTWDVLPPAERSSTLVGALEHELRYVRERLARGASPSASEIPR